MGSSLASTSRSSSPAPRPIWKGFWQSTPRSCALCCTPIRTSSSSWRCDRSKSVAGLRVYEHLISSLAGCGWPPDLAREAGLAVESLVFGSALIANPPDIDLDEEQWLEFPTLAMTSAGPAPNPPNDGFELGFAALIAGLRTLVTDRPASARPGHGVPLVRRQ